MTTPDSDPHGRWRNVKVCITFPVPADDYDLYEDRRFDDLTDTVIDLFPQAVMSGQVVWSDTGETG